MLEKKPWSTYTWYRDVISQKEYISVVSSAPSDDPLNTTTLLLYCQNIKYEMIHGDGLNDCYIKASGSDSSPWTFIRNVIYKGECESMYRDRGGLWISPDGSNKICASVNGSVPYWHEYPSMFGTFRDNYTYFNPSRPDPVVFTIPTEPCKNMTTQYDANNEIFNIKEKKFYSYEKWG